MSKRSSHGFTAAGIAAVFAMVALLVTGRRSAAQAPEMTVYKSTTCGCCKEWIKHVEDAGFKVVSRDVEAMGDVKRAAAVPEALYSCHTANVGGYLIEGHVPADLIQKLLEERPKIAGLAAAGMPQGAPGMEQSAPTEPYQVRAFTADGKWIVYAVR